jgi:hypothetical protein
MEATLNMNKYLVVITRETRAERPSEEFLDPSKMDYLSQSPTSDSFIQIRTDKGPEHIAARLLQLEKRSLLVSAPKDGIIIIAYPHGGGSGATELRAGSTAQVQVISQDSYLENINLTLEEAQTIINGLHDSDGYSLIDEGSNSLVMQSRPSLWNLQDGDCVIDAINNLHGRTDEDRY